MQSFERARLVAVDVVAELQPLGEPDEYVNLSPTTGPVPVMVPNSARPAVVVEDAPGAAATADATVEIAVEEIAVEERVPEETAGGEGAVDSAVADETVDAETVEAVTVEDAAIEDEAVEGAPTEEMTADESPIGEPGERDDVVVDLFARLRAEAVHIEPDTDTETVDVDVEIGDEATGETVERAAAPTAADEITGEETADEETVDEAVPSVFARRDEELTPIIVTAARKLKRVLADEQNEVLETLRRPAAVRDLAALLPATDAHAARYADAIAAELGAAADAGAASVDGSPGDATAAIAAGRDVLTEWLVVPLRERLERCVADGDGDNAGIGKRVRAVYREWKTQRIDEHLDDVVRAAHGRAVLDALPAGTPVVWAADDAHRSCADCDDNTLAGAVAAGDAFPTGHTHAPAHVGCRCLLVPDGR
jgi:hypothetical protein